MPEVATIDVPAESSPAPAAQPQPETPSNFRDFFQAENDRALGKPAKQAKQEPSAEGEQPKEKAAPASEAGNKDKQEQHGTRTNAKDRKAELNAEIQGLLDRRKALQDEIAGLGKGKPDAKAESSPAPKQEAPKGLEPPKKPNIADFSGDDAWQKFEEAKDKYFEDLADYKAQKRLEEYQVRQREEAQQRELSTLIQKAGERYGEEAGSVINKTSTAIIGAEIHPAIKSLISESPVMVDLMYVAGQKPEDLAAFLDLAKTNPGQAIRKVVLMEKLVQDELAKGGKPDPEATPERDESGKFVKQQAPEKPQSKAPAPGTEVSGRSSAPPDPSEQAFKAGDMRAFREAENRKALARSRGL